MPTAADLLVRRLRDHGVRHVFGYPGGQLTPIYDALYREPAIRHVLARDEQAAGFMADGYARATGRPGVALAVCGPGVFNAATPLATALTDSVPFLLISGQIPTRGLGQRTGFFHENELLLVCDTLTKKGVRATSSETLAADVDNCFLAMAEGRPGPVLLEIPLDVQRQEVATVAPFPVPAPPPKRAASGRDVETLGELLAGWRKPLLLAGGGVVSAGAEGLLAELARRLGAPVFHTFMGKCALSSAHPLKRGLPWSRATSDLTDMAAFMAPEFAEADGLLAVGCRFTQAATGSWALRPPPSLAQIDVDAAELGRHYPLTLGVHADAAEALRALLRAIPERPRQPWSGPRPDGESWRLPGLDLLGPMRRVLPRDTILSADVTRLGYVMLADFPVYEPRTFLHPAGFVAMGYGIPAALGAKAAHPERCVVAVVGDGCFLMSAMELATSVQEKLPVIVVLVNDRSLTLIKAIQQRRFENRFLGVDLVNPDFGMLARAFGIRSWQVGTDGAFESALREAVALGEPALIEVRPADAAP
jgi:thiamine pyrophosphate-dependent acetolactate synthase large subunit-like protein